MYRIWKIIQNQQRMYEQLRSLDYDEPPLSQE